jgi:hypothetical protein
MAEDPKDKPGTSTSPAPTDVAGDAKKVGNAPPPPSKDSRVQAEPLSDGTVPTVLAPGETHRTVPKSKASIANVYRRADVTTTLFTFGAAVVAAGLILGGYAFFTHSKTKPPATPKVTKLDKSDLDKLDAFFNGNSAGKSSEVLTISSSSLFKNRVAVGSDLKVVGGLEVSGPTSLGDLNVDKTSNLGVTNVRGSLTVSGPLNLQSPALINAGAAVKGNLAVSGNGSFGGSISAGVVNVQNLSVTGTLNLNGHLAVGGGSAPSVSPGSAAGLGAAAHVVGNDTGGTVSVTTGSVPNNSNNGGELVKITFSTPYPTTPTIVITPDGRNPAMLQPYIVKTANFFIIDSSIDAHNSTSYAFEYFVVQ